VSRKFIKKLKSIKTQDGLLNPDRAWVARNRERLISDIRQSSSSNNLHANNKFTQQFSKGLHIFVSNRVLSFARTGMTMVLVGAIAISGWIVSVSASSSSLPGEVLYNVKMAKETAELIVASVIGSEEDEVTTMLKHASTRVDEYQNSKSSEQATQAIKSLKKKIESTGDSLAKAEKKSSEKAVAVAKVIEEKTDEILISLSEEESVVGYINLDNTEEENLDLEKELSEKIGEAEGLIEETGIKAVEVLIEKFEKQEVGEGLISKEEVKESIAKKLNKLVADVSKIQETNNVSSTTINIVKLKTVSSTEGIVLDKIDSSEQKTTENIVTGTSEQRLEEASNKVSSASQKVEETNQKVEVGKLEVGDLIEQNNLSAAMDKIKELGEVKNETKVVVTEASNAVINVLKEGEAQIVTVSTEELSDKTASSTLNSVIVKELVEAGTTTTLSN